MIQSLSLSNKSNKKYKVCLQNVAEKESRAVKYLNKGVTFLQCLVIIKWQCKRVPHLLVFYLCLTFKVLKHPHNDNLTVTELKVTPSKCFFFKTSRYSVSCHTRRKKTSRFSRKWLKRSSEKKPKPFFIFLLFMVTLQNCLFGFGGVFFTSCDKSLHFYSMNNPLLLTLNSWTVTFQCFLLWFILCLD